MILCDSLKTIASAGLIMQASNLLLGANFGQLPHPIRSTMGLARANYCRSAPRPRITLVSHHSVLSTNR